MAEGEVTAEDVAEAMYNMIAQDMGKKKYKPTDLTKGMIERFGADKCSKKLCKEAIRKLIDSERCVYSYFGGSFIEIPHKEGAAPDSE